MSDYKYQVFYDLQEEFHRLSILLVKFAAKQASPLLQQIKSKEIPEGSGFSIIRKEKEDSLDFKKIESRVEIKRENYFKLDFPPSPGLLTINGLAATREVIIPIDAGLFSLIGIKLLTKKIGEIKAKLNPSIKSVKVLLTRVDSRTNFSKTIKESIEDLFGDNFFNTVIHQNIRVAEAQSARKPISYFDKNCRAAREYSELAKEIEKG